MAVAFVVGLSRQPLLMAPIPFDHALKPCPCRSRKTSAYISLSFIPNCLYNFSIDRSCHFSSMPGNE